MKVCHVNNYARGLHRYVGGAETAMARTAAIAAEHGHEVFLVTLRPDAPEPKSDYRHYAVRRWEDFVPCWVARGLEPLKWYVWQHDRWASRDFEKILARERPDIVHFHNVQFPGLDLIRVAKQAGARVCYTVYDYWAFCPNVMLLTARDEYCRRFHGAYCADCLPPVLRSVQRRLLSRRREVFDRYLQVIDRWIVLSEHSAGVVEQYGIAREKIRVVRLTLPFEFESFEPEGQTVSGKSEAGGAKPNAERVIFFAGWLQKRKGVHVLLEALPAILKECRDVRLRIAGLYTKFEWDYKRKLRRLLRQPEVAEHVTFLGHLNPKQIEQELRRCTVVVIPEQYENMSPLLMIEAMTLARPLVISRAGGIPEFIEDGVTGWLADPRRPDEFAEKILYVLRHSDEARAAGLAARRKVLALCDSARIAADTMAAYEAG